jgi:hypothetical protein
MRQYLGTVTLALAADSLAFAATARAQDRLSSSIQLPQLKAREKGRADHF